MFRNFKIIVFTGLMLPCYIANAQLVKNNLDSLITAENFETGNGSWTVASNNDNLFLIQGGNYMLNRKNTASPYAVISGMALPGSAYKLITSLKLQKTADDKGSIGLLFALQDDKHGGYLIEINNASQYRIRQLSGSDYFYLTGSRKNNGWEKSEVAGGLGAANNIEIRTADYNYDIYLNGKFLKSISNSTYSTGSFGFVIGPGSKGSIDFVQIYGPGGEQSGKSIKSDDTDVAALAQSIMILKTEVNKLQDENDVLRKTINAIKSESKTTGDDKKVMMEQLTAKQNENNTLKNKNDSLVKANAELKKYKEMIAGNDNGDLVINLSKSLKAEKEKNTSLQLSNKKLQEELNNLKQKNGTTTPQNNQQKKTDDFNLPK